MCDGEWELLQDLFDQGLSLLSSEREALLCKLETEHGAKLCKELAALWQAHAAQHTFEQVPNVIAQALLDEELWAPRPDGLKDFTVLERIGSGGMGVVFKARQHHPVDRDVALKVLPLTASREQLRRFQDEQRALALIDHENVASVYGCGETAEGQPFYAMSYLESEPITIFCDRKRLSVEARLDLVRQVCKGVGQAHQKGIIHRDLKPENVLVVETEQGPVVKIIDFGIAKFSDQEAEHTLQGQVMGTPGYMSPEQAMGDNGVDTLSDIYALGSLLYELLCGTTPHKSDTTANSPQALLEAARYQIPKEPHRRLAGNRQTAKDLAHTRNTTPQNLERKLRGEPGWITMKALAFEPGQRYATCEALERDIHACVTGLPVEAGPPSHIYRLKKILVYYRKTALLASLFIASLICMLATISLLLVRTTQAEAEVRTAHQNLQAVHRFTQNIFHQVDPAQMGRDVTGFALLQQADRSLQQGYQDQPELEAATRLTLGRAYSGLGYSQEARNQLERALRLAPHGADALDIRMELAYLLLAFGEAKAALFQYSICEMGYKKKEEHALLLSARGGKAQALSELGRFQEAVAIFQETLSEQEDGLGKAHKATLASRHNLANTLAKMGQTEKAQHLLEQNIMHLGEHQRPDHPFTLRALHNQAELLQKAGNWEAALDLFTFVLAERKRVLGSAHPETLLTQNSLAVLLGDHGQTAEALSLLLDGLTHPEEKPLLITLRLRHNLGNFLMVNGEAKSASQTLACLLKDREMVLGEFHPDTLRTWWTLGEAIQAMGKKAEAMDIYAGVVEAAENHLGQEHGDTSLYRRIYHHLKEE